MSSFEVKVRRVDGVREHPKADRLSILQILGFEAIVPRNEDGSPRYRVGDLIAYIPEQSVLPEDVLKEYGFWKEASAREDGTISEAKGMLAGNRGNRVKIATLRGVASQGLIFPLRRNPADPDGALMLMRGEASLVVKEGDDVADFLSITKYDPPIPPAMSGEIKAVPEMAFNYDIENWQNYPGFLDNDEVVAVEKCHGTNFRICYHPTATDAGLFGETGQVGIASKSLGAEGKMFKASRGNLGPLWRLTPEDVEEDRRIERNWRWANKPIIRWVLRKLKKKVQKPRNYRTNLYVGIAINQGLIEKVETLGREIGQRIDLFGEVFGAGVQKLDYGQKTPTFRAFDIAIDRKFADEEEKVKWFARLGVERLPVLYRGPWNETALIQHRDGKTVISGTNIREGVVVTAIGDQSARETHNGRRLRPFLKMVSPAYLAKEDGSEIQ